MGTSNKYAGGTYMKLHRRLYNLEHDIYLKDCTGLNDTQYELACYCKEHDIKQRRKYTYYYTMTHKTDGLTPEGFCVLYRQKNADKVAKDVLKEMADETTDPVAKHFLNAAASHDVGYEIAVPIVHSVINPTNQTLCEEYNKNSSGISLAEALDREMHPEKYNRSESDLRKIEKWKKLNPEKANKKGYFPYPDTLNEDGTKIQEEEYMEKVRQDAINRHEERVKEKETLGEALNKKIKDDTVYKIYIKGDDLKQLTDILQTPAMKSQYRVEVIDNRIKIDSIPQKAQNDISDALRNLGVDEGTLQNLMPQIRRLSAEASKHARVLSDRDVKETSQNA